MTNVSQSVTAAHTQSESALWAKYVKEFDLLSCSQCSYTETDITDKNNKEIGLKQIFQNSPYEC